jgi:hypothetical protein
MGLAPFSVPCCRPTFVSCFLVVMKLCEDSRFSNYQNKTKNLQVLPNIYKILTHSYEKGIVSYICRQNWAQDREIAVNRFPILLSSSLVYGNL